MGDIWWCITCSKWTTPDPEPGFVCSQCGEGYQCDECGFEIDRAGNCLRAETGAGECPSTTKEK